MGLFDWFAKPKTLKRLNDVIWMTQEAKLRGIVSEIEERSRERDRLLIVAHFPATLNAVLDTLGQVKIEFEHHQHEWDVQDTSRLIQQQSAKPIAVLAETLPESSPESQRVLLAESLPTVSIICVERHPLPSHDDHVTRFAQSLPSYCRLQYLLSLADPLLRLFAGDETRDTLVKLGMKEDERIESRMVTRRIRGAQKKIQAAYAHLGDISKADSPEEWFLRNAPQ